MRQKLGIVIPLKSKAASRNWATTCESLNDTIKSIDCQTSKNFHAVIVGHDKPDFFNASGQKVQFHRIESEPPHKTADQFTQQDYTLDKNSKIVRGMQLLKPRGISYWFALDADDLIDRNFVKKLFEMDLKSGGILDGGHIIYKKKRVISHNNISLLCGSTSILCDAYIKIPEALNQETMKIVPWCRYSHTEMQKYFESELNQPYVRIDEELIGYVMGHGDNCSDGYRSTTLQAIKSWLKPILLGQKLSAEIKKKYSL